MFRRRGRETGLFGGGSGRGGCRAGDAAAHFDVESLPERAAHFCKQAEEERDPALRIVKFVVDAGGRVEIPLVPTPQNHFETPEAAAQKAVDGEPLVTRQINGLMERGLQEKDHLTQTFLQWCITEQWEEVSSMEKLLRIVQRAGNDLLRVEEYLARHQKSAHGLTTRAENSQRRGRHGKETASP